MNNWSLKKKLIIFSVDRLFRQETNQDIGRRLQYELYDKDDIETLRKKLIEDIDKEFRGYSSPSSYQLMMIAKDIINKRFGVEE